MKQSLVWVLSLCLMVTVAVAQEMPEMTAEEKAAMEAWIKAGTPGDPHQALSPMVGSFDVKMTMWHAPDTPGEEVTATSESRWVLGGRWVEQKFNGSVMGQPYEGLGYTGYDNMEEQYVATWMDSMSTYMMTMTGKASADGKKFSFSGMMPDPALGKSVPLDDEIVVVSPNRFEARMYSVTPEGKRYKMMEFIYTRK
jgi:hypothetical protein